jgi:hypothetical protein
MTDSLCNYLEAGANCKKLTGSAPIYKIDLSQHETHSDYLPVFIPTLKKANTHSNHDHVKPGGKFLQIYCHTFTLVTNQ